MLNNFEFSILEWIKNKYQNDSLSNQIDSIINIEREYTKVGFFISIILPESTSILNNELADQSYLSGPIIRSSGIEFDGCSILFIVDGKISTLELAANGSFFEREIEQFKLF
jgi:hypothetical protein